MRDDLTDRPGVFVLDADAVRRHATVGLLAAHAGVRVLGAHAGSIAAVALAVQALPHVCVLGSRVLAGPVPELVAEIGHALPATRCIRAPKALGLDRSTLSPAQRDRQVADAVQFVRSVLAAAGCPAVDVDTCVRAHLDWPRAERPRRVVPTSALAAMVVTQWTLPDR